MSGPPVGPPPSLVIHSHRSPHPFFTPTHITFIDPASPSSSSPSQPHASWQSRRARKGRYAPKTARIHTDVASDGRDVQGWVKKVDSRLRPGLKADISFWVAMTFTFGSMVWVVNGYLVWFPIIRSELESTTFYNTASAFAFIGGTVFEIGSYLGVVEALDRGREITFGTALGEVLHHRRKQPSHTDESVLRALADKAIHETQRSSSPGSAASAEKPSLGQVVSGARGWVWWGKPMWHDMGYLAEAVVQMFAATIFWISTITGLPGVIPGLSDGEGSVAIIDIFFWAPQVIGGCGFILSSLILMIEVQHRWYLPNVTDIGWQVGFWNLVGAFGFMLCGAFGFSHSSGLVYQSGLSTFWGSWAFLIGSGFQVWETIWREHPPPRPSPGLPT